MLGNVSDGDLHLFRTGRTAQRLELGNQQAATRWRSYPCFEVCRGWCPHERYVNEQQLGRDPQDCCGLSALLAGLAATEPA